MPGLVITEWDRSHVFTSAASAYVFICTERFVRLCHERSIRGVQFGPTDHFWDYRFERSAKEVLDGFAE